MPDTAFLSAGGHNLTLLIIAAFIGLVATQTSFSTIERALFDRAQERLFVVLGAVVTGLAMWAPQVLAILATEGGTPIGYGSAKLVFALMTGIGFAGAGWWLALRPGRARPLLGGAIIGIGIGATHYLAMDAVVFAGTRQWHPGLVALSFVPGVLLAAVAVALHVRRPRNPAWVAAHTFALGILLLHHIGMHALTVTTGSGQINVAPLDGTALAGFVGAASLAILGATGWKILFDFRQAAVLLVKAQERAAVAEEIARGAEERERLSIELAKQAQISAAALGHMAQGLCMFDAEDRLVIHNDRFAELYHLPAHVLLGGASLEEIHTVLAGSGLVAPAPPTADRGNATERTTKLEVHLRDGRIIEVQRRALPGGGWVATHDDVTQARRSANEIAFLAAHDTLTGLPNRATFNAHLVASAQTGGSYAVHMIDLDRFKEVNDTLGHPAGDEVIRRTASCLRDVIGPHDIAARLGGDEFAIVQKGFDGPAGAISLGKRIIAGISEAFEFQGHTIEVGASVGIALAPAHGNDAETLMKASDLALYSAKEAGRGQCTLFERAMDDELSTRRQLEAELRLAITEKQFVLHFQPLMDMGARTIDSVEALLRWEHPTRGLLTADEFIAVAEETGLIVPIGEWILQEACSEAATWPSHIRLAVNVSPAQFRRGDFTNTVVGALASTGFSPDRLELEVTEAILLQDEAVLHTSLTQLAQLGISFAMDDFGTGYSSLNYLRTFPFKRVKIDRSFVADLTSAADALSVIQATIELSRKLGLGITAEGVETANQLAILDAEGCTQAQGYHISHPLTARDIRSVLRPEASQTSAVAA